MRRLTAIVIAIFAAVSHARADGSFDPATGFRIAHYRAALPDSVPGGVRVDRDKVDKLIAGGAVLLDVMASEGAGPHPETGAWQLSRGHNTIPGATWLPDVGKGRLTPAFEGYLAQELLRLSGADKSKPMIIFCQADCWMSWNAVQRIRALGYTALYWYPEGTDGWVEWGDRKLAPAVPAPFPKKAVE